MIYPAYPEGVGGSSLLALSIFLDFVNLTIVAKRGFNAFNDQFMLHMGRFSIIFCSGATTKLL